jgi:hypothetical protein
VIRIYTWLGSYLLELLQQLVMQFQDRDVTMLHAYEKWSNGFIADREIARARTGYSETPYYRRVTGHGN